MTSVRAFVCLVAAMATSSVACSSSDPNGDGGGDAAQDSACTRTDVCCCSGDVVDLPQCAADGAISCRAGYTFYTGSDCSTKCTYPMPYDSGPRDTGAPDTTNPGDTRDETDAGRSDPETGTCTDWDADWGDTPKPDVMSPCRSSCDCPSGYHCCAAASGLTCAPAFECP